MIGPADCCYVCLTTKNLHKHHIMYGSGFRKLSEKYDLTVMLCARHHNMSDAGVHFNKTLDIELKKKAQQQFEEKYGHEQYMAIFSRNYLEDDDGKHNSRGFFNLDEI